MIFYTTITKFRTTVITRN